jgi:hypothetical protein
LNLTAGGVGDVAAALEEHALADGSAGSSNRAGIDDCTGIRDENAQRAFDQAVVVDVAPIGEIDAIEDTAPDQRSLVDESGLAEVIEAWTASWLPELGATVPEAVFVR